MKYPLNRPEGTLMVRYTTTKGAKLLSVDEFHQKIVSGQYREEIEAIVKAYQEGTMTTIEEDGVRKEVPLCDVLKKALPYFVVQADVRARRLLPNAKAFTGYVPVDMDHLSEEEVYRVMDAVGRLPWVKEAHRSSRGEGVHLIVAMGVIAFDASDRNWETVYRTEYQRRYRILSAAVSEAFGVQVDGQCKDVLRGFFVSHDPKAYLRPDEEVEAFDFPEADPTDVVTMPLPVSPTEGSSKATATLGVPASAALTSLQPALIQGFLTYHSYRPSERHGWWIKFATYLKFKGIGKEALALYQQAMQWHLVMHQLIKADDPLLRSAKEVEDAMDWGYTHAEVKSNVEGQTVLATACAHSTPHTLTSEDVWSGKVNDEEELARLKGIRLPEAFRASLTPQPEKVKLPTLCGIMPMAQTYATEVKVRYCDGKLQRLNGMSCIIAEQGGLKSGVKDVVNVWKQPLEEADAAARQKEDAFKELRSNRKANEKLPTPPKDPIIGVTPTISCSALLKRLKRANGKHLFSFCEEIDTVRKTNGAGSWSAKYDVYRLSFDNGEWGQDYNSDQAESGMVNVAYNWTFMGTPQAMMSCFAKNGSVENGLTARAWPSIIPPARYEHMPKYKEMDQQQVEAILQGVEILRAAKGLIDTPRLRKAIEKWCDGKADEAAAHQDEVLDTFRKRAAVIGFRAGVTFHILEQGEQWLREGRSLSEAFMEGAEESLHTVHFALLVADHALKYQCLLYGSQLINDRQAVVRESGGYRSRNKNLFEELPAEFTFDLLVELRPQTKYNALRTMIYKWKHDGLIEEAGKNCWRKRSILNNADLAAATDKLARA